MQDTKSPAHTRHKTVTKYYKITPDPMFTYIVHELLYLNITETNNEYKYIHLGMIPSTGA